MFGVKKSVFSIDVINARNAFSERWGHFSKLYLPDEVSNVLAFVDSLNGVTSRNNFSAFIKEKAAACQLPEVIQGIDARLKPLEQSSCVIL